MFYSDSAIRSLEPFLLPQDLPVFLRGYHKLVLAYFLQRSIRNLNRPSFMQISHSTYDELNRSVQ